MKMTLEGLGLRQLAGQRLMIGFDGTRINGQLRECMREFLPGGLVLFSRNLEEPAQIQDLCRSVQDYARTLGIYPLLIAVDQEGGVVARLKPPAFTGFPGNPGIKTLEDAAHFARVTARELKECGFNMDLAPVVDVAPRGLESIMAARVFPGGADNVAALGEMVIRTLQDNGVLAVAKHFPGIGRTTLDSHLDLPVCTQCLEDLEKSDLVPFEASIRAGVSGIMLTHVAYPELDPLWPASLSENVVRGLLREKMGFEGLILTVDLDMGAIVRHFPIDTSIRRVLAAGVDIALICHPGPDIGAAHGIMVREFRDSPGLLDQAFQSVGRILEIKKNMA